MADDLKKIRDQMSVLAMSVQSQHDEIQAQHATIQAQHATIRELSHTVKKSNPTTNEPARLDKSMPTVGFIPQNATRADLASPTGAEKAKNAPSTPMPYTHDPYTPGTTEARQKKATQGPAYASSHPFDGPTTHELPGFSYSVTQKVGNVVHEKVFETAADATQRRRSKDMEHSMGNPVVGHSVAETVGNVILEKVFETAVEAVQRQRSQASKNDAAQQTRLLPTEASKQNFDPSRACRYGATCPDQNCEFRHAAWQMELFRTGKTAVARCKDGASCRFLPGCILVHDDADYQRNRKQRRDAGQHRPVTDVGSEPVLPLLSAKNTTSMTITPAGAAPTGAAPAGAAPAGAAPAGAAPAAITPRANSAQVSRALSAEIASPSKALAHPDTETPQRRSNTTPSQEAETIHTDQDLVLLESSFTSAAEKVVSAELRKRETMHVNFTSALTALEKKENAERKKRAEQSDSDKQKHKAEMLKRAAQSEKAKKKNMIESALLASAQKRNISLSATTASPTTPPSCPTHGQDRRESQLTCSDWHHAALETLPEDQVRNILGEKLHRRIMQKYPDQAGKVTGMLLEMDNAEVAGLLDASDLLMQKADEAVKLLETYADGLVATQEGLVANAEEALPEEGPVANAEEALPEEGLVANAEEALPEEGLVANAEEALPNREYHECSEEATTMETP